jgi:hypothetical protein
LLGSSAFGIIIPRGSWSQVGSYKAHFVLKKWCS